MTVRELIQELIEHEYEFKTDVAVEISFADLENNDFTGRHTFEITGVHYGKPTLLTFDLVEI